MTDTVIAWLRTHPMLGTMKPEQLEALPGCAGLFCKGNEILSRRTDILGNTKLRVRLRFLLAVHCTGQTMPQALLTLADWVAATAPTLGEDQTAALQKGQLVRADGQGVARYEAELTFEFTR